ncbi:polysaccharide pyruvyl transferase family protein [Saliphagus sp. LR7]|uniref:polysaccharide pyruvyl transferase family protein n=1 Tax=Saliphagus sp. LR7 TaxID=2282654 RepID=UPI000DF75DFB|nr:polysaccharide pyruvyl transferase family protein [Saliphagus sp. LR7]
MSRTVYFVNDTTTSENWGCRGTTRALRGMVAEAGGEITDTLHLERMDDRQTLGEAVAGTGSFPARLARFVSRKADLEGKTLRALAFVHGGNRRGAYEHYESIVGRWDEIPVTYEEYPAAARAVRRGELLPDVRRGIEESDLVLINGEGSIYDRQRKGRMTLFVAYLAREFDTDCALVNHTADVHDPVVREIAANVYPRLTDVVFREPFSADACAEFLPDEADRSRGADAAFTYEPVADREAWERVVSREGYFDAYPDSAGEFDPGEPYVCVGGSSIYNRPDRPAYDPAPAFADLCRRIEREVAPVVLTACCGSDAEILRPVADELGLPLVGPATPVRQAIDVLGEAAGYVGGRWHPSIYALTGGTPVVTLTANTYKTAALIEQVGLDGPTFDALALEGATDRIVALLSEYVDREGLEERLQGRAGDLSERARRNVRLLEG